MSDVEPQSAQPSASSDVSLGTPYNHDVLRAHRRPAPKTAYGFLLNPECHRRWSRWYCELVYKEDLATMSPKEAEELAKSILLMQKQKCENSLALSEGQNHHAARNAARFLLWKIHMVRNLIKGKSGLHLIP